MPGAPMSSISASFFAMSTSFRRTARVRGDLAAATAPARPNPDTDIRAVCVCVCVRVCVSAPEMPGRHDLVFLCDYCALCVSGPEMPGMHELARVLVRLLWPVSVGPGNARNARPCVCPFVFVAS